MFTSVTYLPAKLQKDLVRFARQLIEIDMNIKTMTAFSALFMTVAVSHAQLIVEVLPVKITGQKAVVPLTLKNNLSEKIESARAVVFLLDEQGKMVGQSTKWVIGGSADIPGLAPSATNSFHFVIASDKPFVTTNLTAKVSFSRIVIEGGKLGEAAKDVKIENAK